MLWNQLFELHRGGGAPGVNEASRGRPTVQKTMVLNRKWNPIREETNKCHVLSVSTMLTNTIVGFKVYPKFGGKN